jgi:hypothetical protein
MKEIWKPVYTRGFSHLYEVSNLGRVRSKERWLRQTHPKRPERIYTYHYKGRVLKLGADKDGYAIAVFCKKRYVRVTIKVHQLVARAFCKGYKRGLEVNHKNGVKNDNFYKNIEWLTPGKNQEHRYRVLGGLHPRTGKVCRTFLGAAHA